MKENTALRLWTGHTVHQRSIPFSHRFKYRLALIDVDIDRLDDADHQCAMFSVERSNLFSFNRTDHADHRNSELRSWADQQFQIAGIDLDGGTIRLITFPRHAFFKFAPISLWMGHDPMGALKGILYEVNNTFGETHVYAAPTSGETRHQHLADKAFHVSPFFDVSGTYQFTLRWSPDDLRLIVATQNDGVQSHMATITARARPANSANFIALALTKPFSTLGVAFGIHWQALKLWLKGAKYHPKPKQGPVRTTIADQKQTVPETAPRLERTA